MVRSADGLLGAATGVVNRVSIIAGVTLSGDEVEGLAVDLDSYAGAVAEFFSGFAAGEGRVGLDALAGSDDLVLSLTGEAVSGEWVEVVALAGDINAEETVL